MDKTMGGWLSTLQFFSLALSSTVAGEHGARVRVLSVESRELLEHRHKHNGGHQHSNFSRSRPLGARKLRNQLWPGALPTQRARKCVLLVESRKLVT